MSGLDGNELTNDAHTGGSPPGIREVVRDLTGHLGPTLVAGLAGDQDPGVAGRWAQEGGPAPDPSAESRLRRAHQVWGVLAAVEGEEVARLWFLGANPWLGEVSPVEAIAQGRALKSSRRAGEERRAVRKCIQLRRVLRIDEKCRPT